MVALITTLPGDLIWEIAKKILADDVVNYVCFRATCLALRSSLPDPYDLAFCFLPRNWIRVYINYKRNAFVNNPLGAISRIVDCYMHSYERCRFMIQIQAKDPRTHIPFMHLPTGRHAELVLPELETHSILSITDGLLILVHEQTRAMRLFNPLTRCMSADLPPTSLEITKMSCYAITAVAPSRSIIEQPTLMIALDNDNVAYFVKPGDQTSLQIQLPFCITSALFFQDGFYCTDNEGSIWEIKPDQTSVNLVFYHDIDGRCWHLVQSRTGLLLIDFCPELAGMCNDAFRKLNVFKFDLNANTIIPTNDIGNCTIFVGMKQRALLVTPTKISIKRNSIYISYATSFIYHLKDKSTESNDERLHILIYCPNIMMNMGIGLMCVVCPSSPN